MYLILAVLGVCMDPRASLVMAYRLSCLGPCEILDPCPGMESLSPALEGTFLTTGSPAKSLLIPYF